MQTERQLLEWLVHSSMDGIAAFDCNGFLTVWNPGMERIFGVSAKDALGKPAFLACPFMKELGEDVHFAAALKGKKVLSGDKCFTMPGAGKPTYFESYYGPMYNPSDGEIIGGLAIIRDVTGRRLAEEGKRAGKTRYGELFESASDSGKPYRIQDIARHIAERTKTEETLHHANKKVESWVQQLEQRTRERMLQREVEGILRACRTTKEAYKAIARTSQELFPARGGALFVLDPMRNMVEDVAWWGDIPRLESAFSSEECRALSRRRVHCVENERGRLLCKHLHASLRRRYLCVPMVAQGDAMGVLHLAWEEDSQMPEAVQRLAVARAACFAAALCNLKLRETLRSQPIRDPLTGLFNRGFMEESLGLELRQAVRTQHSICVILISLDDFQRISKKYGLEAGASILHRAGMLVRGNVRNGDIGCRFSGCTYAVILRKTGREVGKMRAQTLCDLAQKIDATYRGGPIGPIAVSAGLSVFPGHGQTVESLLSSAEAALARARGMGGNCVVVAG